MNISYQEKNLRFGFYVSGRASRLVKIIEQYPAIIQSTVIVINDEAPNSVLRKLLEERNVEYIEFNYGDKELKGKKRNNYISELLLEKFEDKVDYAFCFGSKILTGKLLEVFQNKIINFHPAILPMFPGVRSIDQALNASAFLLGNTAHFIDSGMDTGPVIIQSVMHSSHFKDYEDVLCLQLPMIYQIYWWLREGRISVTGRQVKIENSSYPEVSFYPTLETR